MDWFLPVRSTGQRPATVSVLSQSDREAVGSGVLLPRARFLTCAHVINCALGKENTICAERPAQETLKVLVHGPDGEPHACTARLAVWIPPGAANGVEWDGDLAVLEFVEPLPAMCGRRAGRPWRRGSSFARGTAAGCTPPSPPLG
ncbi:hypothetical protein SVIO_081610 [Streptomyces violaceusniger]|uniref:Serine protease n=1 Tax=Streptomyces violaceusniger TaxID=68280 RepID=A0A4D4LGA7_STRVO|nr:hypothetical protein SVIO_081610 [Streptomyces violaceusniger]